MSEPDDSMSDAENQVHGSRPLMKKSAYGRVSLTSFGRR